MITRKIRAQTKLSNIGTKQNPAPITPSKCFTENTNGLESLAPREQISLMFYFHIHLLERNLDYDNAYLGSAWH